ncbi:sn-glycerol-3-phosphate ABC transporter ATP-binding protein UgpC [Curvibacter sp. CHRR-16]|uniref:ABC transporter ATP-binding protein n=1 Tax=Curvibacter sp. CHRR-16 TaxID=2835872 RepID=UPI001BD9C031|nr:sn-glycerol-3-phosphate ABC transporter ATP-binding protein UgpC [Curvibacter sp. CHRR-16]MBT0570878.1 sn-glycerol-3-phosphate ABC transporter ATP-binding protein UgpC [Curvibacter sp. CHRR-16]
MAGLSLRGISKSFDGGLSTTVKDVSLDIADNEFCVFVGPSGCGKSTLLRMIAGLEDVTAGDLLIGGRRVNELAPSERNVAMVFQNYALYPHMDVATNIAFGMRLAGYKKDEINHRVSNIAQVLQIEHLLERLPKALSGGQRQRVAIGRALVRDPGVFLFDEPLSNLDAALRTQMRVEIARMHREYGKASSIYVTHDQVEAMTLADKIVLLHSGEAIAKYGSIAQVGSPMELYLRPKNLFVAGFIGSPKMNFIQAVVSRLEADGVWVKTADGRDLQVAVQAGALQVGDAVTLGVRSEHLSMVAQAQANTLPCRVNWVERLGDMTYAYLDVPEQAQITLRLPGDSAVAVGDVAHVHVPAQHGHVFDKDGQALPALNA